MERHSKGEFHALKELKLFKPEFFFKQFCMTPEKRENLLVIVARRITKSTLCGEATGPMRTLCVISHCLAFGDSKDILASYRIIPVKVSCIINEACLEIWDSLLQENCISPPETPDDWKEFDDDYYRI